MSVLTEYPDQCRRAADALERRYGVSTLPLLFSRRPTPQLRIKVEDLENGAWVKVEFSRRGRARVVAEQGPTL